MSLMTEWSCSERHSAVVASLEWGRAKKEFADRPSGKNYKRCQKTTG